MYYCYTFNSLSFQFVAIYNMCTLTACGECALGLSIRKSMWVSLWLWNDSLFPRLPNHFNIHEKRGGAWDPISRDKCWHDFMKDGLSTTWFQIAPHTSVHQTQVFEAFDDPTTFTWRLWYHIFHPRWTEALENNMARPCTIITTCHPSYPYIWSDVCHVILDLRLTLFSCVC